MSIAFGMAIYFMLWWIILFAILPFGLRRTQEEAGEVVPGSEPSAPDRPHFSRVIILTTVMTTVVFAAYLGLRSSGYGLDDIPFLNPPTGSYSHPSN
jgi:predicted secreted protein